MHISNTEYYDTLLKRSRNLFDRTLVSYIFFSDLTCLGEKNRMFVWELDVEEGSNGLPCISLFQFDTYECHKVHEVNISTRFNRDDILM